MGPGTDSDHFFILWHPYVPADGDDPHCLLDVTPSDMYFLRDGTQELVDAFARTVGISEPVESWRFEEYCTPYYADSPDAKDHQDRFRLAWRVRLRFATAPAPRYGGLGPYYFNGVDRTSEDDIDALDWTEKRCVVIGDVPAELDPARLDELSRYPLELLDYGSASEALRQVRLDLGVLTFPEQEQQAREAQEACAGLGLGTTWLDAYHGPMGARSRSLRGS